jgi:hypothetical protein
MDWFKGKFTGKPHISWENLWFPVDFPLNQSIESNKTSRLFPVLGLACLTWQADRETQILGGIPKLVKLPFPVSQKKWSILLKYVGNDHFLHNS